MSATPGQSSLATSTTRSLDGYQLIFLPTSAVVYLTESGRLVLDSYYRLWLFPLQLPTNRSLDKAIDTPAGRSGGRETSSLRLREPACIAVPGISKPMSNTAADRLVRQWGIH